MSRTDEISKIFGYNIVRSDYYIRQFTHSPKKDWNWICGIYNNLYKDYVEMLLVIKDK